MTSPVDSHSPESSERHITDDYLSDGSPDSTGRKTIQGDVRYIGSLSAEEVERPSRSRLNQDFYSFWPQNKKSQFDYLKQFISV